ncbi:hypothetical protein HHK36_005438 [Tetracentron sinense]|uniref:F-box domain-containing protein n=1 Tax=Tetracentron sinense TaxID=13715 RepID=A0A835DMB7_TETSI|nr:hypothetical protein HHK36_005438 [Tetracentron sinense]
MASRRKNDSVEDEKHLSPFPDEVLERVLVFVKSHRDRSSVSLVCKDCSILPSSHNSKSEFSLTLVELSESSENGFISNPMRIKMGDKKGHKEEERSSPELSTGKSSLRQAIELISSLVFMSLSVKVFPVKWQLIRKKLEELNSCLTAAQNGDSNENSALSDLIPAILLTVRDSYDLARRCVDLSYSGKLLMQSDLDVVSAKFELHLKNLARVYTAGIPNHGYAIIVSRPGIGACRDDMKFYVKDLLTRLKIGNLEMKGQALVALNEVVGGR